MINYQTMEIVIGVMIVVAFFIALTLRSLVKHQLTKEINNKKNNLIDVGEICKVKEDLLPETMLADELSIDFKKEEENGTI